MMFLPLALLWSMSLAADPDDHRTDALADPNSPSRVAVVIGLSLYDRLPDEVELDFARSDAATVAEALKQLAHYDYVFLLTDREATKANILETLQLKAAQFLGPGDTLLIYFVGHGVAADFGAPTLMAFDSPPEAGQQDAIDVSTFVQDVATWTRAGRMIIVTDAIHKNQLEGIPLHGPAANQWPPLPPNTVVISASNAASPGRDGAFGVVFADAVSGAADTDSDGDISANELYGYLDKRMIGTGQAPAGVGELSEGFIIASGVTPGMTALGAKVEVPIVREDYEVYAAKFVFREGASQTVACMDVPVKSCDPTCYVRNFHGGTCTVTAVVDGKEYRGKTLAVLPGRYDCGLRADQTLSCMPPQFQTSPTPTTP